MEEIIRKEELESLMMDSKNLNSIKNNHDIKFKLDEIMCNYICENDIIDNDLIKLLRNYTNYIKNNR
ncbi:hypothetical protein [Clostridium sp.]|uniref:hypothetical protein n=1 Tax=Clostridium sp. TaxID=1506 RepID=UPI0032176A01